MLKILHIAPQNYAGVPYSFFRMHNSVGDYSRIVTFYYHPHGLPEDICLNLKGPSLRLFSFRKQLRVKERSKQKISSAPLFKPKNIFDQTYYKITDKLRKPFFDKIIHQYNLDDFGIIHYDTGLDFYRNSAQAKKWKAEGKKIVCCYYGSDLRIRGIIKEMDELSDLNITSEYDHLALKPDLKYLFYPYDPYDLPARIINQSDTVRIVHSPTNRQFKGTELILSVINRVKKERKIEFFLLENMPYKQVLEIKRTCDICIDQVGGTLGGTGYGKAGLETLAMGIPTITNMTSDYEAWLPENPFVVANNESDLFDKLIRLIDDENLRIELGEKGTVWVNKYHGFENVNSKLKELYKHHGII